MSTYKRTWYCAFVNDERFRERRDQLVATRDKKTRQRQHHVELVRTRRHYLTQKPNGLSWPAVAPAAARVGRRWADGHDASAQRDSGTYPLAHRSWVG